MGFEPGQGFEDEIASLPDAMLGAPDHEMISEKAFSYDPYTPLGRLRDGGYGVIANTGEALDHGIYAGQYVPNVWGHDLTKPHFIALSFDAVEEIGKDRERFLSAGAYGAHIAVHGETLNAKDGMDHFVLRRLFDGAVFGRAQMMARVEELVTPTVEWLVLRAKTMLEAGLTVDARRDIALPVTYRSMADIIGTPLSGFQRFVATGEAAQSAPRDPMGAMQAIAELDAYFEVELEKRKQEAGNDLMSAMLTAEVKGRKLTEAEIIQHCRFLLPGGIETTWRQTANLIFAMLSHPDQFAMVVADPALADQAVEEVLRFLPSGFVVPRICGQDTEIAGTQIPAGAAITSIQGVANRDPEHWEAPDSFNIRREAKEHLTFHTGVHYCMGQHLARFTLKSVLLALADHLPNVQLAVPAGEINMHGFGVRCPDALPLGLSA